MAATLEQKLFSLARWFAKRAPWYADDIHGEIALAWLELKDKELSSTEVVAAIKYKIIDTFFRSKAYCYTYSDNVLNISLKATDLPYTRSFEDNLCSELTMESLVSILDNSRHELEVINGILAGYTQTEIANSIGRKPSTVSKAIRKLRRQDIKQCLI